MPTWPTSGSVKVTQGTAPVSKRCGFTRASLDRALPAAISPIRAAAWVNCRPSVTSPTAQMPRTFVAIVSSVSTNPPSPRVTPTSSSPKPPLAGSRPIATRTRAASTGTPAERCRRARPPTASALSTRAPSRRCTPSASRARATMAEASGSSRGRTRSSASITVTWVPRRATAWAISTPSGPPPSTVIDTGRSSRLNRVSVVRMPIASSPSIGGTAGVVPVATMTRRARRVAPSTSTTPGALKIARPWRTAIPCRAMTSSSSLQAITTTA